MIMQRRIHSTGAAGVLLLLALAGCFKLSRSSPEVQFFVLTGSSQAARGAGAVGTVTSSGSPATSSSASSASSASMTPATGLTIGMRRLDLASYLSADPGLVVRRGSSRLDVSEFHRWAGDLDEDINRAVAAHLVGVPPVRAVDVAPWSARDQHDFLLQLHVSRFEGVADSAATTGHVHVLARWDIIRPLDNSVLLRGTTDDREGSFRVGDYARLATELDAALSRLAREIGACLARFPNDSTPPAGCGTAAATGGSGR